MIKTNIKMRVTPEQSAKVQEICFENGIDWTGREKIIKYVDKRYLFILNNKSISYDSCEDVFNEDKFEEIDPDLFIRTNGSCIEKEEFTYPMWFKNKAFRFYSLNIEPHTSIVWKQIENPNLATDKEIEQVINEEYEKENSINNGGKTDYYQLENAPFPINDFDDFAEWRGLNGNQFNMGKVAWTFNTGRHNGTDYERDLNKIIHYAKRELLRLKRDEK